MAFHNVQLKIHEDIVNERMNFLGNTLYDFRNKMGKREENFNGLWQILMTIIMSKVL